MTIAADQRAGHFAKMSRIAFRPLAPCADQGYSVSVEQVARPNQQEQVMQSNSTAETVSNKPLSRKAARAIRKWGSQACRTAWYCNRLCGEGLTVCSIESGIPLRSVDSAINAFQEVNERNFDLDCARGARMIAEGGAA